MKKAIVLLVMTLTSLYSWGDIYIKKNKKEDKFTNINKIESLNYIRVTWRFGKNTVCLVGVGNEKDMIKHVYNAEGKQVVFKNSHGIINYFYQHGWSIKFYDGKSTTCIMKKINPPSEES